MQGRINRRSSYGSQTSLRRSSISARDIAQIQAALQRQNAVTEQAVSVLLVVLPLFSLLYSYAIHVHKGDFIMALRYLFGNSPYLLQLCIPLTNMIAWKIVAVIISVQLMFYWFIPHDSAIILHPQGDQVRSINGFWSGLLLFLLYVMGSGLGLYRGDIVYLHFQSILLNLGVIACMGLLALWISNRLNTCEASMDSPADFYWGVHQFPHILDIDVKHFLRTRITYGVWGLLLVSSIYYQIGQLGHTTLSLKCCAILQIAYIGRHLWDEHLYLNSNDQKNTNVGLYRLWSDLVLLPLVYSSPAAVLAGRTRSVGLISSAIFTLIGVSAIVACYLVDRQKFEFRRLKVSVSGNVKILGRDPFFIAAKYRTDGGDVSANLLLGSGYWASVRHPNYACDIVAFLAMSCLQGTSALFVHLPCVYVCVYLVIRVWADENRCLAKYGQGWIQHCCKVPFRLVPGLF